MSPRQTIVTVWLVIFCLSGAGHAAEEFSFPVPTEPPAAGRHVLLVANYDHEDSFDADFAVADPRAGGMDAKSEAAGHTGGAARVVGPSTSIHYNASQNVNPARGTVALWVKVSDSSPAAAKRKAVRGTSLSDGRDHWLWSFRAGWLCSLLIRGEEQSLVFGFGGGEPAGDTSLSLPLGDLDAGKWHHVLASWDLPRGRLWLALDGHGVTGQIADVRVQSPFVLFIGSCAHAFGSDFPLNGLVDELVIYDVPADELAVPREVPEGLDLDLLARAEDGARRFLNFWQRHQKYGGWGLIYVWPTMLPCEVESRTFMKPIGYFSNDKGWATATVAAEYLYAFQVLGDRLYLEVAQTTGEMYLATLEKSGAWSWGYVTGPQGARPLSGTKVKLQDSNQAHPTLLLGYLYRVTGDERFLRGAMAGGDLVLEAQNPNGSWSHSFDLKRRIGLTDRGLPQGGEINDSCTNDGMDLMLFMYHLTKDQKYLDALVRAGDWLIEAQSHGPTFGWAEQYDRDNNPVWARNFEPPCDAPGRSILAVQGLQMMWDLTGDEKYLSPIGKYLDWLDAIHEDGGWWRYYDPQTGRPVLAIHNQMFLADDPEQYEAYCKLIHADQPRPKPRVVTNAAPVRAWLEEARTGQGRTVLASPRREDCRAYTAASAEAVAKLLETQHPSGPWVRPRGGSTSCGAQTRPRDQHAIAVLRFIEQARMALGELPLARRGGADPLWSAYPESDWYETPLRKGKER